MRFSIGFFGIGALIALTCGSCGRDAGLDGWDYTQDGKRCMITTKYPTSISTQNLRYSIIYNPSKNDLGDIFKMGFNPTKSMQDLYDIAYRKCQLHRDCREYFRKDRIDFTLINFTSEFEKHSTLTIDPSIYSFFVIPYTEAFTKDSGEKIEMGINVDYPPSLKTYRESDVMYSERFTMTNPFSVVEIFKTKCAKALSFIK